MSKKTARRILKNVLCFSGEGEGEARAKGGAEASYSAADLDRLEGLVGGLSAAISGLLETLVEAGIMGETESTEANVEMIAAPAILFDPESIRLTDQRENQRPH